MKLPPIWSLREGSIIRSLILYYKRLFLQLELVTITSYNCNFTIASSLSRYLVNNDRKKVLQFKHKEIYYIWFRFICFRKKKRWSCDISRLWSLSMLIYECLPCNSNNLAFSFTLIIIHKPSYCIWHGI